MSKAWVVVANRGEAKIFERNKPGVNLNQIHELQSPDGQVRDQTLVTDRPGVAFDSGHGQHPMRTEHSPTEKAMFDFAGEIAANIEKGRCANAFESLDLIAEPRFLGALRNKLSNESSKLLDQEIDKDVVSTPIEQIQDYLRKW